jgi:hypothetical protein
MLVLRLFASAVLTLCGCAVASLAAAPVVPAAVVPADLEELNRLGEALELGSETEQATALKKLGLLVKTKPQLLARHPHLWCDAMLRAHRFRELAAYAQRVVNSDPSDLAAVMLMQPYRTRAFLYEGAWEKALFSAKGMYNVCTIDKADEAIALMVESLRDARRADPQVIEQFKTEQVRGAQVPLVAASTGPQSVLGSIREVGALAQTYDKAIAAVTGRDCKSWLARGNLNLLADRVSVAKKCFETAYQIADEKDLDQATESLARAMKAEDGATGRAAAWLAAQQNTSSQKIQDSK